MHTEILEWLKTQVRREAHLRLRTQDLQSGDVFVALKGHSAHGLDFVETALQAGAAAILFEPTEAYPGPQLPGVTVPSLAVPGLRAQLGAVAHHWYGEPSTQLHVVAITGTNGKTSCASWLAQCFNALGMPCATVGTLGFLLPSGERLADTLTTPDVLSMHAYLRDLVDRGVQVVCIEASSIGLEQGRLDGVQIEVAAFTNFTQDHLDYHGSLSAYAKAKALLFARPELRQIVLNAYGVPAEFEHFSAPVVRYAIVETGADTALDAAEPASEGAPQAVQGAENAQPAQRATQAPEWLALDLRHTARGQSFELVHGDDQALVDTAILGRYNVANMLLCAGVLGAFNRSIEEIAHCLSHVENAPGRLSRVQYSLYQQEPLVLVDYAHTPDALKNVVETLGAVQKERGGRLWVVFGCGGDRDADKRPKMRQAVEALTPDYVLTSDNPRSENPKAILAQMLGETDLEQLRENPHVEPCRATAIMKTVLAASAQDIVLIAGKGHETYQEVQGVRHHFDDAAYARLALLMRTGAKVQTDSREVKSGDIFVALKGENHDAHDYLPQVASVAAAAVVSKPNPALSTLCQIQVHDTTEALGQMAKAWRLQFDIPVVAITGSNGKTTTKEMVASIMKAAVGEDHRLKTEGNFNNHIGVPLTLLRLKPRHQMAVVEVGMNHPGEIAYLADLVQPTVALINNAQREHQEFMKSVQGVADENGAVLDFLPEQGVGVFPSDAQPYTDQWETRCHAPCVLFGFNAGAEVTAKKVRLSPMGSDFFLCTVNDAEPVHLSIAGEHNVRNALAAASCAIALNIDIKVLVQGLESMQPAKGRMQPLQKGALNIIDDSYNANPDSVRAAIDALAQMPGPRALVLGDMAEVGADSRERHAEVGAYARECGIEQLWALGSAVEAAVAAFGPSGQLAATPQAIAEAIAHGPTRSVLVKGSRSSRMERVVDAILDLKD